MLNYSKHDVILVRYPFTDSSDSKIRPAVVVSAPHSSQDIFIVPLTSRTRDLQNGEFVLQNWTEAGLSIETAVKRGVFTVADSLVRKRVGKLSAEDTNRLDQSLKEWFGI